MVDAKEGGRYRLVVGGKSERQSRGGEAAPALVERQEGQMRLKKD